MAKHKPHPDNGVLWMDCITIFTCCYLIRRANKRVAAVGRREIQVILIQYMLITFFDLSTTGQSLPLRDRNIGKSQQALSFYQQSSITAIFWSLHHFGYVLKQTWNDGTLLSMAAIIIPNAMVLFPPWPLENYLKSNRRQQQDLYFLMCGFFPFLLVTVFVIRQFVLLRQLGSSWRAFIVFFGAVLCLLSSLLMNPKSSNGVCSEKSGANSCATSERTLLLTGLLLLFDMWKQITDEDWSSWSENNMSNRLRSTKSATRVQDPTRKLSTSTKPTLVVKNNRKDSVTRKDTLQGSKPASIPWYWSIIKRGFSRPVIIHQPTGLDIDEVLSELNKHKQTFLDQVEREVKSLIKNSRKRDCAAIVAIKPDGRRLVYRIDVTGWTRRLIAMTKAKNSIATYEGDQLDSYLSQPIVEKVSSLHEQFLQSHGDVLGKYSIHCLRNSPVIREQFARQFAASVRAAGKPLSEELTKALIHLIHLQLSSSLSSDFSQNLSDALTHVASTTAIASFTSLSAHALQGVLTKVLTKFTIGVGMKSAMAVLGKIIGKTVVTSFVGVVSSTLAIHGVGLSFPPLYFLLAPAIGIFTALEINAFPGKLADKIAPDVKAVMSGEFEKRNRSVLEDLWGDMLTGGMKTLCDALVEESGLNETAVGAAREMCSSRSGGFSMSL